MTRTFRYVVNMLCALLAAVALHAAGQETGAPAEAPPVTYSITTDRSGYQVDWITGQLEVVGQALASGNRNLDMQQARVTAYSMVTDEAQRGMLTIPLDATTTLGSLVNTDELRTLVDGVLANLQIVDERWNSRKKTYTVVGVLPLYGERGVSTLASKISALLTPLTIERSQLALTRPIPRGATPQRYDAPYSGVIINADQVLMTPCLFSRLVRFDGKEFWGPSNLTPEELLAGRAVRYAKNVNTALRQKLAGPRPLVLNAVGSGQGYHPVFNVEDVMLALTEHKTKGLLARAPIIITLGQQ